MTKKKVDLYDFEFACDVQKMLEFFAMRNCMSYAQTVDLWFDYIIRVSNARKRALRRIKHEQVK